MEKTKLKMINLYYEKKDAKYMLILEAMLEKYLELLHQYLDSYKKITLLIRFNAPKRNIKNCLYINLNTKSSYMSQLHSSIYEIIRAILKNNINPCYNVLLEHLVLLVCNCHMNYPLEGSIEDFLKSVYTPKKELLTPAKFNIYEMQLTYLYEKYGANLLNHLCSNEKKESDIIQESYKYLKEKYVIDIKDITTPKDAWYYVLSSVKYGWYQNGNHINHISSEVLKNYNIPSIKSVLCNHIGCCIDISRVLVHLLRKLGYTAYVNISMKEINGKKIYHAYTMYCDRGDWYCIDTDSNREKHLYKVGKEATDYINRMCDGFIIERLPEDIENESFPDLVNDLFGAPRKKEQHNKL